MDVNEWATTDPIDLRRVLNSLVSFYPGRKLGALSFQGLVTGLYFGQACRQKQAATFRIVFWVTHS